MSSDPIVRTETTELPPLDIVSAELSKLTLSDTDIVVLNVQANWNKSQREAMAIRVRDSIASTGLANPVIVISAGAQLGTLSADKVRALFD